MQVKAFPLLSQTQTPRGPVKQTRTDPVFQALKAFSCGRTGNLQLPGCRRKITGFTDPYKNKYVK
nr:hypothetical protein SUGSMm_20400 [Morganella morganii subsp. sibonii]